MKFDDINARLINITANKLFSSDQKIINFIIILKSFFSYIIICPLYFMKGITNHNDICITIFYLDNKLYYVSL